MAVDKFTLTSGATGNITLNHSLGEAPKTFIIATKNPVNADDNFKIYFGSFASVSYGYLRYLMIGYNDSWTDSGDMSDATAPTSTQLKLILSNGSMYLKAGREYTLITMA